MNNIKYIAFDADDTLWINEPYYQEVEAKFQNLLKNFLPEEEVSKELLKTEIENINLYGFGAKGFMLSMIETAIKTSKNEVSTIVINEIIALGKSLIDMPIELLKNVEQTLISLKNKTFSSSYTSLHGISFLIIFAKILLSSYIFSFSKFFFYIFN